jgi:hypothetical protein
MEQLRHVWDKQEKRFRPAGSWNNKPFVKGPIPVEWLAKALLINSAPTVGVALVLWYLSGIHKTRTVRLSSIDFGGWEPNRFQKSRALAQLTTAGLIRVESHPGRAPVVTVLVDDGQPNGETANA